MKSLKPNSKLIYLFSLLFISSFAFISCDDDSATSADSDYDIVETAANSSQFTIFAEALYDTELDADLSANGPFTVFAPTNDAFNALPSGLLESLTNDQLTEILQYHVLAGEIASGDLNSSQAVETLSEETIYVTVTDGVVSVNNTTEVISADIMATNGIIHAIDGVILPNSFQNIVEIASKNYELSTLVSLVADAELVSTLEGDGPFTLFAPTNAAFEAVGSTLSTLTPEQVVEVLTYHVAPTEAVSTDLMDGMDVSTVQGENISVSITNAGVMLNDNADVISVDIQGTNGVIHIIDNVILPPSYTE